MGDTFDRVRENSDSSMLKELARIISENEMVINRDSYFHNFKYIIVAETKKGEESDVQWDGRLKRLQEHLELNSNNQIQIIKGMQKTVIEGLVAKAEKLTDKMEESTQKKITNIQGKADEIEKKIESIMEKLEKKDGK